MGASLSKRWQREPRLALQHTTHNTQQDTTTCTNTKAYATHNNTLNTKHAQADLFAQKVMEGKRWEDVDWRRHGLFCTFGLFYLVSSAETRGRRAFAAAARGHTPHARTSWIDGERRGAALEGFRRLRLTQHCQHHQRCHRLRDS